MTLNERHYQQQISYKNTTIGLKLIVANGRRGDGELICCNFGLVTKPFLFSKIFQVDQSIYQICSYHYTFHSDRSDLNTDQNVPIASKFEN